MIRYRHSLQKRAFVFCGVCILLLAAAATAVEVDTTAVRKPERPPKSVGETILDVTSAIIQTPVYPVKGIAYGGIWLATESPLKNILFAPAPDISVYPVASYGSNSGVKGGLGFFARDVLSTKDIVRLKGYYSTHDYQRANFNYHGPQLFADRIGLRLNADYRKRPWESFYGLGNDSHKGDEISYTMEQTKLFGGLTWQAGDGIVAELFGGYTISNTSDGKNDERLSDLDSIATALSLTLDQIRSTQHWTLGATTEFDWRDHPGRPTRGGVGRICAAYHGGTGSSDDLEFFRIEAAWAQYIELFQNRVLALRGDFTRVDRDETAPSIPFYLRSGLGGKSSLRGYRSVRFVDNDLILLSAEYRYPLWQVIDGFVFVEEGRVFRSLVDDLVFTEWKYSAGVGVRFWGRGGEGGRMFIAHSKEGTRFYINLGADW